MLILFLRKGQLVSTPGQKHILLFDNVYVPEDHRRLFSEIIVNYCKKDHHFVPLVWIPSDEMYGQIPASVLTISLPATSKSVLKRILTKIAKDQNIPFSQSLFEKLVDGNQGDLRQAINNFQLARRFSTGSYESLNYFQSIGEILYRKRKRPVHEIVHMSQQEPKPLVYSLYENYLDFLVLSEDYSVAADYFSIADNMFTTFFSEPEYYERIATICLMGVLEANRNPPEKKIFSNEF